MYYKYNFLYLVCICWLGHRFDGSESVVIVAAQKRTLGGRELQLPCMSSLTSKTSTQKFFLRVLQVIIQLREDTRRANKKAKQTGRLGKMLHIHTIINVCEQYPDVLHMMKLLSFCSHRLGSSSLGSASSIQAAVRQLEAEADAIIQMVREGQRARRLQQAPPPTASAAIAAGSSVAAPHAPTGAAPPAGTAAAATVSMGCTDSRHTSTHTLHTRTVGDHFKAEKIDHTMTITV